MDRIISLLAALNGAGFDYKMDITVPTRGFEDEEVVIIATALGDDRRWIGKSEESVEGAIKNLQDVLVNCLKSKAAGLRNELADIEAALGK
jgi:hypothetical protein